MDLNEIVYAYEDIKSPPLSAGRYVWNCAKVTALITGILNILLNVTVIVLLAIISQNVDIDLNLILLMVVLPLWTILDTCLTFLTLLSGGNLDYLRGYFVITMFLHGTAGAGGISYVVYLFTSKRQVFSTENNVEGMILLGLHLVLYFLMMICVFNEYQYRRSPYKAAYPSYSSAYPSFMNRQQMPYEYTPVLSNQMIEMDRINLPMYPVYQNAINLPFYQNTQNVLKVDKKDEEDINKPENAEVLNENNEIVEENEKAEEEENEEDNEIEVLDEKEEEMNEDKDKE